jgi:hypothetical protein
VTLKRALQAWFALMLAILAGVGVRAGLDRGAWSVWSGLGSDAWGMAAWLNAGAVCAAFYLWVAYREPGLVARVAWLAALLALGGIAVAAYALLALSRWDPASGAPGLLLRSRRQRQPLDPGRSRQGQRGGGPQRSAAREGGRAEQREPRDRQLDASRRPQRNAPRPPLDAEPERDRDREQERETERQLREVEAVQRRIQGIHAPPPLAVTPGRPSRQPERVQLSAPLEVKAPALTPMGVPGEGRGQRGPREPREPRAARPPKDAGAALAPRPEGGQERQRGRNAKRGRGRDDDRDESRPPERKQRSREDRPLGREPRAARPAPADAAPTAFDAKPPVMQFRRRG